MITSDLNYLAILVAAIVNFMLGGLWFSPILFAKAWMKEMKINPEDCKNQKGMGMIYLSAFLLGAVAAFLLALLIKLLDIYGALSGAALGCLVSLLFVGTSIGTNFLFEKKSFQLFWITIGHHVLTYIAMGAILGAWQ
jgi:hypothetical protein